MKYRGTVHGALRSGKEVGHMIVEKIDQEHWKYFDEGSDNEDK